MIRGFDGQPISIDKKGIYYPVTMELCEKEGKNFLHIQIRSFFAEALDTDTLSFTQWKECIFRGFSEWAGEYTVFGGQQLTVTVTTLETDTPSIDSIPILCLSETRAKEFIAQYTASNQRADIEKALLAQRSFSTTMLQGVVSWKAILPRYIVLMPSAFDNEYTLQRTAKHEFGHILGIGDSYKDSTIGYQGVGMYHDILPYYKGNGNYDMVMDNCGPVRNNDIEMIILAFFTNQFQDFQKYKTATAHISHALGRGD